MLGATTRIIRRFGREDRGVVLILFLLVFMPLLLTAAVVMDFSQTLVVKRQLTGAVDAAALTLGEMPELQDPADMRDKAEAFIKAHYPANAIGELTSFTAARDGDMVNVSATAEIPTAFLGVTGKDSWQITVNSSVFRKDTKLELVMVLDNSGSMAGNKIAGMKRAAIDLVDTLFGDEAISSKIKVGLVPFTAAVRTNMPFTGNLLLDLGIPSLLNAEVFTNLLPLETTWTVLQSMRNGMANWGGCLRSRNDRNEPYDIRDDAPNPLIPDTLFSAHFRPFLGGNKSLYVNQASGAQNEGCPTAPVQELTNVKSTITSAINAMTANGNTNIPEGLAWGWRLISPQPPFTAGASYADPETLKVIVLLTDGENSVSDMFSSYGQGNAGNPHIGPNVNAGLDTKLTALCQNIKANQDGVDDGDDIVIYTIAFAVSGPILTRLNNCATNIQTAFNADSIADLRNTFAEIASSLKQLRLAR
jgi:Flp pilus assembly protein TadG